jgi:UPF0271 protein
MTPRLDLNADLGEHDGPPPPPALSLLQVVTSANIACGGHAGDQTSMRTTMAHAQALGVQIGAHPSYPDRAGFGRRVMPMAAHEVRELVARQVAALCEHAVLESTCVRHVKPHGALYNLACRDREVAGAIAAAIVLVDRDMALYAPHASALAQAGTAERLRVIAEGFLDRAYEDDGTLTPREVPGAVLHDTGEARVRVLEWVRTGRVRTRTGLAVALPLETLCVHGDTPDAVAMAGAAREVLMAAGIALLPSQHR